MFIRTPLFVSLAAVAATTAFAGPQVWNNSKKAGSFSNFSGTWDSSTESWTAPVAKPTDRPASTGTPSPWQPDSLAWFGGNGAIAASPAGTFTVTVDAVSASGLRQIHDGAGEYTLEGGTISITGPNGIRVERGTFTVNSSVASDRNLILYLMAADEESVLVLGGDNLEIKSGSVCLNGNPGIVRLTNAGALGSGNGNGSLELRSSAKSSVADTLDLNGLTIKQSRTLDNPQVGEGTARLINDNTSAEATFVDKIHLRSNTLLAFGGNGAGLTLAGVIGGDGTLTTTGSTTVTVTNNNTYSGGTTIGDGSTLLAGGSGTSPTGPGAISIGAGGTLAGAAGKVAIPGLVTTNDQTSGLAPGATPASKTGVGGQLTLASGLNAANGATVYFDLGATASATDLIKISPNASFTGSTTPGAIVFRFNKVGQLGRTYVLIDFTGASASNIQPSLFKAEGVAGTFAINGSKVEFRPAF